jgi:hypothetical protein
MDREDELTVLHRFLSALEKRSLTIVEGGKDVTARQVAVLKPEIESLEFKARVRAR